MKIKNFRLFIIFSFLFVFNLSVFSMENTVSVDDGNKYYIVDSISFKYDKYHFYIAKHNGLYGVIEKKKKKLVIPCEFDRLTHKSGSLLIAEKNGKKGIISYRYELDSFKYLIPIEYDEISIFPFFILQKNGKYALLNRDGSFILPFEYDSIKYIDKGLYVIKQDNILKIYDAMKNSISSFDFDDIEMFDINKYLLLVTKNNEKAIYDYNKKKIIFPFRYSNIENFNMNNFLITTLNEKKGLYSIEKDKIVLNNNYKNIKNLYTYDNYNLILVQSNENDKLGLISYSYSEEKKAFETKIFIPFKYDKLVDFYFTGNYSLFKRNDKYVLYNKKNGKEFHNEEFDDVSKLKYGYCKVKKNNKYALLDLNSEEISDYIYDDIEYDKDNLLKIKQNNKWRYIERKKFLKQKIKNGADNTKHAAECVLLSPIFVTIVLPLWGIWNLMEESNNYADTKKKYIKIKK